jgi:hypothetical protein
MRDSAASFFRQFSAAFEGNLPFMYLDTVGLVTTGIGNLIDPIEKATPLAWRFKTSTETFAGNADKIAEWNLVKADPGGRSQKGGKAFDDVTTLMLNDDDLNALFDKTQADFERELQKTPEFSGFPDWPADAQLGIMSMAWAMGPAFGAKFPSFRTACSNLDFFSAAKESKMKEVGNAGLVPRNRADELCFTFAARAIATSVDPDTLIFPSLLIQDSSDPTKPLIFDMELAPKSVLWKALKKGDTGGNVRVLRVLLGLDEDGDFDDEVFDAVLNFQRGAVDRFGDPLNADGVVGMDTWRALAGIKELQTKG